MVHTWTSYWMNKPARGETSSSWRRIPGMDDWGNGLKYFTESTIIVGNYDNICRMGQYCISERLRILINLQNSCGMVSFIFTFLSLRNAAFEEKVSWKWLQCPLTCYLHLREGHGGRFEPQNSRITCK